MTVWRDYIAWSMCLCFAAISAQSLPPQPESAQNGQVATFRTGTNLVVVDVVVRDHGQAVPGLTANDFRVLEDGQLQKIVSFEEHKRTDITETSIIRPQLPPDTFTDAQPYAITSSANVLLLDALNTPLADQKFVRANLLRYLHSIPPGTRIAVFTLGSKLRVVQGFASDTSIIEKALSEKRAKAEPSSIMDPLLDKTMSDAADIAGSSMAEFAAETRDFESQLREEITIDALTQLSRYLSTIPGRKNLIWMAGSFPFSMTSGAYAAQGGVKAPTDYQDSGKRLEELLTMARVAVYPIDPQGLEGAPSTMAETNVESPGFLNSIPGQVSSDTFSSKQRKMDQRALGNIAASHSAMDLFAQSTGGKAFYNTNALAQAVATVLDLGSSYYTLAYSPGNRDYNGAFRSVAVSVGDKHYDLAYRPGYFAVDPMQEPKLIPGRLSPLIAAMQHGALPVSQVPFTVRVIPVSAAPDIASGEASQPSGGGMMANSLKHPVTRYVAEFTIDPAGIESQRSPNGLQHREVELTQVLYDPEGNRINFNDFALAINKPAEAGPLRLTQQIDVPTGHSFLRLGVNDRLSGRIGAIEIGLDVKQPAR